MARPNAAFSLLHVMDFNKVDDENWKCFVNSIYDRKS